MTRANCPKRLLSGLGGRWHGSLSGKAEGRHVTSHSMLLLGLAAKLRMDCQHRNMAACATGKGNNRDNAATDSQKCHGESLSQSREIIKPTITELTKEVRTNILCTVEGCGKILPNTPALNMHLVKSHRIKVNKGLRCCFNARVVSGCNLGNCDANSANVNSWS